jgi:hypothetical protein
MPSETARVCEPVIFYNCDSLLFKMSVKLMMMIKVDRVLEIWVTQPLEFLDYLSDYCLLKCILVHAVLHTWHCEISSYSFHQALEWSHTSPS